MVGVILTIAIFLFTGFMAVMKGQKLFSLFLTIFAFSLTFEMVVSTYGQTSTTMAIALGAAVVAAILAQYAEKFAFFLLGVVAGCIFRVSSNSFCTWNQWKSSACCGNHLWCYFWRSCSTFS